MGRPPRDMEPADADGWFGKVLRGSPSGTRPARAQALTPYCLFLELRHKVEIQRMTGRVVECPIDETNRLRESKDAALRISGFRRPSRRSRRCSPAGRWAGSLLEGDRLGCGLTFARGPAHRTHPCRPAPHPHGPHLGLRSTAPTTRP